MAFSRGKNLSIYVPLRSGGLAQRSCGTSSPKIARAITRIVDRLRDERRWSLLEAVTSKPSRLNLASLYDADAANRLDELEASLSACLLSSMLDGWQAWVVASRGQTGTDREYRYQVESFLSFLGADAHSAQITPATVTPWIASLTASPGTRRKYFYALKSFVRYLRNMGSLVNDPLAGYQPPAKNGRRERWETEETDRRIVDAASTAYRALFAFVKATGCDVGTARRTLARDIDIARGRACLKGTKTARRQVHEAEIEPWALPIIAEHLKGHTPNAPLWPAFTNSGAAHHHARCCAAVGVADHTLKDARHSVAVRMRFAGRTFEEIAEQLGNSPWQVAEVYARFKPAEREKLRIAR